MRQKILCILHYPPPINGAAMVGQFIKDSEIINEQFDMDYINLTTAFNLNEIGKGGIGKFFTILKLQLKVLRALSHKKYDLCYMTLSAKVPGFYKDFLIVMILKIFRKKIVYHFHNKGIQKNSDKNWKRFLYKLTFKNTKTILLSPGLNYDISKYVNKKDIFYCANGLPAIQDNFHTIDPSNSSDEPPCKLLFLSNMMEEKGVFELLKACHTLKKQNLNFECHFVGAWSDISEDMFFSMVNDLGLSNYVISHGKKYNAEKIEYFLTADIFVFPTYYDCFPLVLIEAMQFKIPIISTPEGGIGDMVIDGETGFLVTQKDAGQLAEKIEILIKNKDLRIKMGLAGHTHYENYFTLETFENKLVKIFESCLQNEAY